MPYRITIPKKDWKFEVTDEEYKNLTSTKQMFYVRFEDTSGDVILANNPKFNLYNHAEIKAAMEWAVKAQIELIQQGFWKGNKMVNYTPNAAGNKVSSFGRVDIDVYLKNL